MDFMFPLTLKKQNQEILFQIEEITDSCLDYSTLKKGNYFSVFWIKQGKGKYKLDNSEFEFSNNSLLYFIPEQTFALSSKERIKGTKLYIHTDFFPMKKYNGEPGSEGVLFNNTYSSILSLNEALINEFEFLEKKIIEEMLGSGFDKYDLLLSYLKIFLLSTAREKIVQARKTKNINVPEVLDELQFHVELNFRKSHSPAYYALLLNKTPKYLNKLVKKYYSKTLSRLIQERVIVEAKRELIQSNNSIKAIGIDLGFHDVFYFSRFFKKLAGISPENYRNSSTSSKGVI